ncbi:MULTISPECIES: DUF6611 family protein [unclassified Mycobacterium]|uniref:DUF6611 family protein n=1 Tax=unclassified Mycobacterium TaxID=2642494 RepID=UPI0029C84CA7|nr:MULTISPECIES: DUF6611 family protein [unclassified Mycobacterium]
MNDSLNEIGDDRRRNERMAPHTDHDELARPTRAADRWWYLMLDGRRAWGSLDISPTRYGVTRYQLTVFPPGIDSAERRLLRAWRAWPTWGAVLWLLTQIALGSVASPAMAFIISTAVYLGIGAVLFRRVASVRTQVRGVCVVRMAGFADPRGAALYAELCSLTAALDDADTRLQQGVLSAAGHEAAWWQVYDRLNPDAPAEQGSR